MQSSVRAVEAYRRSRLIDSVTQDEDKVTPVYRLEEICDLIRSSPADIVKEMVEFMFKRLEHKSPTVKQKTLRLIKYSVGKSGSEYRREIQRQSAVIRNLFHYKGQVDPLKGDALNKAVRDTAHEAIAAIFSSDEKTSPMEDVSKRIQGFGNTNFDSSLDDKEKKTILAEVINFGSTSIKQGLSKISNHYRGSHTGYNNHSLGSYQAPNLRRSISDRDSFDRFRDTYSEPRSSFDYIDHKSGGQSSDRANHLSPEVDDSGAGAREFSGSLSDSVQPNKAEILVDKVATVGGVRLQPSREALQAFVIEAQKLDPVFLHQALEAKLQAHSWQVCYKVLCLLEAILRQKENEKFELVAGLFEDDSTAVEKCLQFPHATLKEKAKKVLSMLGGGNKEDREQIESKSKEQEVSSGPVDLPDLIDTGEVGSETVNGSNLSVTESLESALDGFSSYAQPDSLGHDQHSFRHEAIQDGLGHDPFADVSLRAQQVVNDSRANGNLFSGLSLEDVNVCDKNSSDISTRKESSIFEGLSITADGQAPVRPKDATGSLIDLMDNLSTVESPMTGSEQMHNPPKNVVTQQSVSPSGLLGGHGSLSNNAPAPSGLPFMPSQASFVSSLQSPMMYPNASMLMPTGLVGVAPSGMYMPHLLTQQNFAFPVAGASFNQPVLAGSPALARPGMFSQQQMGANGLQGSHGYGSGFGTAFTNGFDFTNNSSASRYGMETSKKEETKAFDFISDHVSTIRGNKK